MVNYIYVIIPKVSHNLWITNIFPFNNIININNIIHRKQRIRSGHVLIRLQ